MKNVFSTAIAALLATPLLLFPTESRATYSVVTTAVNNYSNNRNLFNSIANSDGFSNEIGVSPTAFSLSNRWVDQSVLDVDFLDPERGFSGDNDTHTTDQSQLFISFYSGHGIDATSCWPDTQHCAHDYECTSPPTNCGTQAGKSFGICETDPVNGTKCHYASARQAIVNGDGDQHGGAVDVSNGAMAYGESSYGGSWASAGTNGGVNLVVMSMSYGVDFYEHDAELSSLFAGLHLYATVMPVYGDTADVADRGSTFATEYQMGSDDDEVVAGWVSAFANISGGGACPYTSGGYSGINGCGCNYIITYDASSTAVDFHTHETWADLTENTNDATGTGWHEYTYVCNYDTSAYLLSHN